MILSAVAATVVLALAGCGGSSSSSASVSPAAYVKSVCTAASSWVQSLRGAIVQLEVGAHGTKSLSRGKQLYVSFVDSLLKATGKVEDQLKAAGTPSVSNGAHLSSELVGAFSAIKSGLAAAAAKARSLPTNSTSSFDAAAAQISQSIRASETKLSALPLQHSSQLHAAAQKDPTCQRLISLG